MASYVQNHDTRYEGFDRNTEEPRSGRLPALMRLSQDGSVEARNGFGGLRGNVETNNVTTTSQDNFGWYNQNHQFGKVPTPSSTGYFGAGESNDWRQSRGLQLQMLRNSESNSSSEPYGNPSRIRRPSHGPHPPLGPNYGSSNSKQVETDPVTLARRKKQIDYGKTTREYSNYVRSVPKEDRKMFHPKTPPMFRKYSRRAWDGLIKQWRLNLHDWSDAGEDFRELPNRSLNTSFSSETGSTSTTSSMARSSLAVLQEMQRGYRIPTEDCTEIQDWKRYQQSLFVDTASDNSYQDGRRFGESSFLSPPVQRPASSLCFPSTYHHFSSGIDFLMANRRQAQSQSDVSSIWQRDFDSLMEIPSDKGCRKEHEAAESNRNGNMCCAGNDLPLRFNDLRLADKLF